jgi:hypothetical protein
MWWTWLATGLCVGIPVASFVWVVARYLQRRAMKIKNVRNDNRPKAMRMIPRR